MTQKMLPGYTALFIALWVLATWFVEILLPNKLVLAGFLFLSQDMIALLLGCGALLLCVTLVPARLAGSRRLFCDTRFMIAILVAFSLLAWLGRYYLFNDYALSRDEEVAEFAARSFSLGWLGRPIPPEWIAYRRAIMPEFFSPYGADSFWTAAYLPLNAAFRALCEWIGDANLAGPIFLLVGMTALWRIALRLFPDRQDVVVVVMLMALTSSQLLVTAMTPYAMTGHFALNMVWLALVLRDDRVGHLLAGVTMILIAGLHQYHYPLPLLAPFLLWFALGRRWGVLAFHGMVLCLTLLLWAKLWPSMLLDLYGPAADVPASAGVADKMGSLLDRLDKWHPLLHLSRFMAWNNLLLIPLAIVGLWRMDWRKALRGEAVALPLGLGALGMAALAIDQGYGWGYRYLHGFIGSFALLAGYGWASMRPVAMMRPIWVSLLAAVLTSGFLMMRAHDYVAPYAQSHQRIMASGADVVLVDTRGGRYVTDVVRGAYGEPLGRPVVMNIAMLDIARIGRLCDRYDVAIFDKSVFLPLGVGAVRTGRASTEAKRAHMAARGCGRLIAPF